MAASKPIKMPGRPPQISHYTTLEGLKGIVTSKSLWASNASFLNDKAELDHALDTSKDVIEKLSSEEAFSALSPILKQVFSELKDGGKPDTYVSCFCRDDDNLSQWRGYGGSIQGISITFDRMMLANRLTSESAKFLRVIYSKYTTAAKVHGAIKEEINKVKELLNTRSKINKEAKYAQLKSLISALLPQFKHIGFKDEREWRFAIQRHVDPENLRFRVSNYKIVPFIEIGKSDKLLPITSVRVGPGPDQELTTRSVQVFLKAHGYDVRVNTSDVPFRP